MSQIPPVSGPSMQFNKTEYVSAMTRMLRPGDKIQLLYLAGRPPLPKTAVAIIDRVNPNGSVSIIYENEKLRAVPGRDVFRPLTNIAVVKPEAVRDVRVAPEPNADVSADNWRDYDNAAIYIGEAKSVKEASDISGVHPGNIDIIEV